MEYSFPRYLLSKQSVDDRALNKDVLNVLKASLPQRPVRIIEVGAGIGTMLRRLIRWDIVRKCEYVMVDRRGENIEYASEWINVWAGEAGLRVEVGEVNSLRLSGEFHNIVVRFERADVFDFMKENEQPADLLIAHAFLDLLPMPDSLAKLLLLTNDSAWLTLNFDGVTSIEPVIDPALDEQIERLYHISMDTRPTGGNSRSGRLLFEHLRDRGAEILAAGASDWVVHAANGKYPDDEAYFLEFILHFIEDSLAGHPLLNADAFANWLKVRRQQIDRGELVYIAHQMDFFIKMKPTLMADRII